MLPLAPSSKVPQLTLAGSNTSKKSWVSFFLYAITDENVRVWVSEYVSNMQKNSYSCPQVALHQQPTLAAAVFPSSIGPLIRASPSTFSSFPVSRQHFCC